MGNEPNTIRARWERIAPHYGAVERLTEWYLKRFRQLLWSGTRGRILEAGAGTGLNIDYYPPGAALTATDLSPAMLARARERAARKKVAVSFREADLCSLPFADREFDTAVATFVFCSLADPVPCMAEMGRVTRQDGRLLFLDHVRIERPVIGPLMDRLNRFTVHWAGEHITHRMDGIVREAGLTLLESRRCGFLGGFQLTVAKP